MDHVIDYMGGDIVDDLNIILIRDLFEDVKKANITYE